MDEQILAGNLKNALIYDLSRQTISEPGMRFAFSSNSDHFEINAQINIPELVSALVHAVRAASMS